MVIASNYLNRFEPERVLFKKKYGQECIGTDKFEHIFGDFPAPVAELYILNVRHILYRS